MRRGILLAPMVALAFFTGPLGAVGVRADAGPEDVRVSVGFDGVARVGSWTPVTVRFTPPAGTAGPEGAAATAPPEVFVWAEDPDGEFIRSPAARCVFEAGAVEAGVLQAGVSGAGTTEGERAVVARTTVRLGRPTGALRIEVRGTREGQGGMRQSAALPRFVPKAVPTLVPSWQSIVLVLGDVPGLARACRLLEREGGMRPRPVVVEDPATLGRTPIDFDAADLIVVCGSTIHGRKGAWPEEVAVAIDGWVRRGGHLLFFTGPSTPEIAASRGTAANWLPGRLEKLVPLRRTAAVETFARSSRPLEPAASETILVPRFESLTEASDAVIDVFEGNAPSDLPLVVRRTHGFGTILWAGVEPDLPPFRAWQGTDTLLSNLLAKSLGEPFKRRDGLTFGRAGTADLAAQLRRAVDTFPDAAPVPFEWIAALAGLYVVALYPAGWWAAAWFKRRTGQESVVAAWLLLPMSVALFTCLAWGLSRRWHSAQWQHARCDCVDIDAAGGDVRAWSFTGTWAPVNATLDRSVRPQIGLVEARDAASVISWFAPSGTGLGGTDAASPHPSLAAADFQYGATLASLDGIPIAAASSRLFEAEWNARWSSLGTGVAGRLDRDAQGTLRGSIVSRLPFPLEGCVLAHAGWVYDVGPLAPGRSFDPSAGRGPRSLAGSLTRRASDRERDRTVRYDTQGRDTGRILEVAGLHAAAGGASYTALEAGRLSRFDLSMLLDTNRAILIGTGASATEWRDESPPKSTADGENGRAPGATATSLWRIVIPIGRDVGGNEATEAQR